MFSYGISSVPFLKQVKLNYIIFLGFWLSHFYFLLYFEWSKVAGLEKNCRSYAYNCMS